MNRAFQTRPPQAATASFTPTRRHEQAVAPPIAHDALRSPGQPLDAATRAVLESRLGHDFSTVRVHTDEQAALAARSVNALAYTVGRDVVFGAGQYAPHTAAGRSVLAHELTHVAQQGSVGSQSPAQLAVGPADDTYEREAARNASGIAVGSMGAPARVTAAPPAIQRQPTPGKEEAPPKKVVTQPPPQNVPPKKVEEANKDAKKDEGGVKVSTKAGAEVEVGKTEKSFGGKVETEVEKEGVGAISGSIGGKQTSAKKDTGETESSSSSEFAVEAKIPVGALILNEKRRGAIAPFVFLKEVGVKGGVGLTKPTVAGELTVRVISLEWEKLKVGSGLIDVGVGVSGVGKVEGEREDDKWKLKGELGGELKGEAKYRPKATGPLFIYLEGSAKLTTTKEGGANFQPGAFTWSVGSGVGVQWK